MFERCCAWIRREGSIGIQAGNIIIPIQPLIHITTEPARCSLDAFSRSSHHTYTEEQTVQSTQTLKDTVSIYPVLVMYVAFIIKGATGRLQNPFKNHKTNTINFNGRLETRSLTLCQTSSLTRQKTASRHFSGLKDGLHSDISISINTCIWGYEES